MIWWKIWICIKCRYMDVLCKKLDGQGRYCDKKELYDFYIVDIKVTNMNLEKDFVLVDIL